MAGEAGPRPPVEGTYLDIHASGALEDRGVAISAVIDDAHLAAWAKDSDGFVKRLGASFAAGDIAEGQVAEYDVEGLGGKGRFRASALTNSTRSLTPSISALRWAVAWLLPVWSRRRHISAPVARPRERRWAAEMRTAPRPQPMSSICSSPRSSSSLSSPFQTDSLPGPVL